MACCGPNCQWQLHALRHFAQAPQLPSGYAGMVTAACFPPLWFVLMAKRVASHYGGNLTRANVQPSQRAKMFARRHDPKKHGNPTERPVRPKTPKGGRLGCGPGTRWRSVVAQPGLQWRLRNTPIPKKFLVCVTHPLQGFFRPLHSTGWRKQRLVGPIFEGLFHLLTNAVTNPKNKRSTMNSKR